MSKKQSTIKMSLDPTYNRINMSDLVVHSHDKNSYQLNFEFSDGCDNPLPLKDAKPRILFVLDNDIMQLYQLKIDSENLGEASFTFVEPLLHYEGIASAYVYVDYEDKKHDVGGFKLKFKKSAIDGEMPEIEGYIEDIEKALKKVDELEGKISDNSLVTQPELKAVENVKANKSDLKLLEKEIENTQSGFLGDFNSESELKVKYPDGEKGYAVVFIDGVGYAYTYKNSSWIKGNVWNAIAIADESIEKDKLSIDLQKELDSTMYNMLINSNFENRANWIQGNCVTAVSNNIVKITGDGTHNMPRILQETNEEAENGDLYYICCEAKTNFADVIRMGIAIYSKENSSNIQYSLVDGVIINKQYHLSDVVKLADTKGNTMFQIRSQYTNKESSKDKYIEVSKAMCINLTKSFGKGNEPSKKQMDEVINGLENNWFDSVLKLNQYQNATIQAALKENSKLEKAVESNKIEKLSDLPVNRNKFDFDKKLIYRFSSAELRYSGANVSTDEINKFEGENTVKLTTNNSENAIVLMNIGSKIDLTISNYIDLYIYVENIFNVGATQIDLMSSSGLTNKFSCYLVKDKLTEVQENGWRYLRIRKSDFQKSGSIEWSDIQYVRIVTKSSSSSNINLSVAKLEGVTVPKGAVSLYFDDGTKGQYTNAFRIMEKYGLRGCINVITSKIGVDDAFVNWSDLREMERGGWVVCSHTHTHRHLWDLNDAETKYELEMSHKALFDRGFYFGSRCLVVPFGHYSTRVDKEARKYYSIVRTMTYNDRETPQMEFMQSHRRVQHYLSPHKEDDFTKMKKWVDNVIENKTEVSIAFHRIDESDTQYTTSIEEFDKFCKYVREKVDEGVLECVTWKDTLTQSLNINPIDEKGLKYVISKNNKNIFLDLPVG